MNRRTMQEPEKQAPFTPELQSLFDRFAREFDLNFAEKVPNLFDFMSQNSLKGADDQLLPRGGSHSIRS